MNPGVIFLLDEDKNFLELYSKILKNKGCRVFATDNLFLLLKYAKTAHPQWIFIDENFASLHQADLIKLINKHLSLKNTHYAIMSTSRLPKTKSIFPNIEFIHKPVILEKLIQISEKSCNLLKID